MARRVHGAAPPTYVVTKKGAPRFDLRDPYHLALRISWPAFILLLVGVNLAINLIFAALFLAVPGSITGPAAIGPLEAFFFSFETLATVGYGVMSPGNTYGHLVATAEIICGIGFTAILTGLTFVRFSRPRAKIVYADSVVITAYNGKPTLMVRVGNARIDPLADAGARLTALLFERTAEGQGFRHSHDLRLRMARLPVFALTWTIMHTIDEASPLHGIDPAWVSARNLVLFLNIEARDPAIAATVHDVHQYGPDAIECGRRYADAVSNDDQGRIVADLSLISATEPDQ
jgi:inward rectifier potassium channel